MAVVTCAVLLIVFGLTTSSTKYKFKYYVRQGGLLDQTNNFTLSGAMPKIKVILNGEVIYERPVTTDQKLLGAAEGALSLAEGRVQANLARGRVFITGSKRGTEDSNLLVGQHNYTVIAVQVDGPYSPPAFQVVANKMLEIEDSQQSMQKVMASLLANDLYRVAAQILFRVFGRKTSNAGETAQGSYQDDDLKDHGIQLICQRLKVDREQLLRQTDALISGMSVNVLKARKALERDVADIRESIAAVPCLRDKYPFRCQIVENYHHFKKIFPKSFAD